MGVTELVSSTKNTSFPRSQDFLWELERNHQGLTQESLGGQDKAGKGEACGGTGYSGGVGNRRSGVCAPPGTWLIPPQRPQPAIERDPTGASKQQEEGQVSDTQSRGQFCT